MTKKLKFNIVSRYKFSQVRNNRGSSESNKGCLQKSTAINIVNGKILAAFPLRLRMR